MGGGLPTDVRLPPAHFHRNSPSRGQLAVARPCSPSRINSDETNYQGSGPSWLEKVPVGPSGPSKARRTGSRAPSSTVWVPV
jgi:hypothetical protein